jgi:hypothetical protein
MNTSELKKKLISQINEIEDDSFLLALQTILNGTTVAKNHIYEEYNSDILKTEEDINSGKLYSQNQVKEKIEEWKKK